MNASTKDQPGLHGLSAVILAAGRGERLQGDTNGGLKPLTLLLGITLLERALMACQTVGVADCYIVVGYGQARMAAYIASLQCRHRMRLHAVPNPDWQEGNGTSVLAVSPHVRGPFLLLMCDHVFDTAILRGLMAAARETKSCLLAVDPHVEGIFDLVDATKVQLVDDMVAAIGKELTTFNAIDTGLFLCRPLLFQALNQARTAGDGSLTGGIRRLIQTDRVQALSIGDRFWMDVDTAESLVQAQEMVLANLQPGGCPASGVAASVPHQINRISPRAVL